MILFVHKKQFKLNHDGSLVIFDYTFTLISETHYNDDKETPAHEMSEFECFWSGVCLELILPKLSSLAMVLRGVQGMEMTGLEKSPLQ